MLIVTFCDTWNSMFACLGKPNSNPARDLLFPKCCMHVWFHPVVTFEVCSPMCYITTRYPAELSQTQLYPCQNPTLIWKQAHATINTCMSAYSYASCSIFDYTSWPLKTFCCGHDGFGTSDSSSVTGAGFKPEHESVISHSQQLTISTWSTLTQTRSSKIDIRDSMKRATLD